MTVFRSKNEQIRRRVHTNAEGFNTYDLGCEEIEIPPYSYVNAFYTGEAIFLMEDFRLAKIVANSIAEDCGYIADFDSKNHTITYYDDSVVRGYYENDRLVDMCPMKTLWQVSEVDEHTGQLKPILTFNSRQEAIANVCAPTMTVSTNHFATRSISLDGIELFRIKSFLERVD